MQAARRIFASSLLLALSTVASAQDAREAPPHPTRQREPVEIPRDREWRHPGAPLSIRGIEQGDNNFRDRTPLLARGAHEAELVDADENYRRQLAMYSEGKAFTEPPRAGQGSSTHSNRPQNRPYSPTPIADGATEAAVSGGSIGWLVLAGVLAVAVTRMVRVRRLQLG